ncbi:hypothetical protein FEM48_Zijuj02G0201400 [Ziziphus jujuba var. spinosa]|uniref:Bulb-type lectin domain-containing protein n=2 Tax=Ziziphus jujuba TaxID=326968 RepID=A0A978VXQ9_ZIZJJ|nr:hypothetical protein FEM48_Zijuj02G0201400 [Ziziphus jujuba var. spinosa]
MASSPLPWNLLYLLLFSPFLQSSTITCQTHRITKGFSLTASFNKHVQLESPSREFAFGFQRIKSDGFLLAVWLNKIPEKTIVWSANRDNLVQEGSKVELHEDSGLILTNQTDKRIWHTDTFGVGVSYGEILNTGNLVLYDQISAISWQSFNEPTDTLLPKQILSRGKSLVARYSEDNYSSGRFLFMLESNGNLVLYTRNFPQNAPNYAYWKSETEGSGFQVMFNESGSIYLQAKNGNILKYLSMTSSSMKDFYQRAILENDGVFRQYVYPKGGDPTSSGWHEFRSESLPSIPPNICTSISGEDTAGGACGFNSYCRIGVNQRRTCSCPSGYTFIDPSDPVKGCKQNFEAQSCDGEDHDDLFEFYSMEQTDWPYGDYQHFKEVDEEWCNKACLSDCFCAVAIFRGRECWKKRVPFANGMMDPSLSGKALIKVRKNDSSPGHPDKNDRSVLLALALCLRKCLKAKALIPGKQVHALLLTAGIDMKVLSFDSKLVGMYATCGDLRFRVMGFVVKMHIGFISYQIMGRGRGKGKRLTVTNHDDPGSGEEEKIPTQKRRGRPQKPLKDEMDEEENEKIEEDDSENAKAGISTKEMKSPPAAENGKKRKRYSQVKEKSDSVNEENGVGTRSSTDDSTKSNGFRHNGSRRKSKPRRAAEAGVECK